MSVKSTLDKYLHLTKLNLQALETLCYVLGAGAFAVFIRWLQVTAGTNDAGLFNKTIWNYLVPLVIFAGFMILANLNRKLLKKRYYIEEDTAVCLRNDRRIHRFLRVFIAVIMIAGGVLLIVSCETDRQATLLRVVSALGILTGATFPWLMNAFNRPDANKDRMCACATLPIIMFAVWLITTYKSNDINGVVWAYGIEIIGVCFALFAFFRAAGFAYGVFDLKKLLNSASRGIFMLIIVLADGRNIGQQIMIVGAIGMLLYYEWFIISNFKQREAPISYQPKDGFDYMY